MFPGLPKRRAFILHLLTGFYFVPDEIQISGGGTKKRTEQAFDCCAGLFSPAAV